MNLIQEFRQSDPLWGDKEIIKGYTMAQGGCFITSLASAMYEHLRLTPGELLDLLKAKGGIDGEGQVIWSALERIAGGKAVLTQFVHTTNHPSQLTGKREIGDALLRIERLLELGQAVILHVDAMWNDGRPDHAIVCWDRIKDERGVIKDLEIMDPITGKRTKFTERYGDPWKKLYGYRGLCYPSATFPEWSKAYSDGAAQHKAGMLKVHLSDLQGDAKTYAKEIYDHLTAPRV